MNLHLVPKPLKYPQLTAKESGVPELKRLAPKANTQLVNPTSGVPLLVLREFTTLMRREVMKQNFYGNLVYWAEVTRLQKVVYDHPEDFREEMLKKLSVLEKVAEGDLEKLCEARGLLQSITITSLYEDETPA